MKGYNATEVKMLAQNQWKAIFLQLAPGLKEAIAHAGHHVACPVHGGADGFRLFPWFNVKGDGICNTCGAKTDGLAMLQWVNGWSFDQAVNAVGAFLSAPKQHGALKPIEHQSYEGYFEGLAFVPYRKGSNSANRVQVTLTSSERTMRLYGADLKRVCEPFKKGDYVRITKIAHQTVHVNGKEATKVVWSAKKVMTPEARQAQNEELERLKMERIAHRTESIKKVWSETVDVSEDDSDAQPVLRYFANRDIATMVDSRHVRCAPSLAYFDKGAFVGTYPALVCAVRDSLGHVVSLHRTYLTQDGHKAPVKECKKLMAVADDLTINGTAIRLMQTSKHVIGIAEGVETALSVATATGLACWSVISEHGMRTFVPPKGIRFVHIFADKDRSKVGQEAALVLQARLREMGIGSRIYLPKEPIPKDAKGIDFNDVLRNGGTFPRFV